MGNLLSSREIILRAVEPSDADMLFVWENNSDIWHISNTLVPFSKHIMKEYAENASADIYSSKQLRLIINLKKENVDIGAVDLFDFDPYHQRAGVGILIHDEINRNKGYATQAIEIIVKYCFEYLHLKQIHCSVDSENRNSLNLFKNLNFMECGIRKDWFKTKNGWIDEILFQLINESE